LNTNTAAITQDERFVIFMLSYVDTIGCETIKRIYERLDVLTDIFRLTDDEMKNDMDMTAAQICGLNQVKRRMRSIAYEYDVLQRSPIRFCTFLDDEYPARLKRIRQNPAMLYSYGALPDDRIPSVAIVGSRACTGYGASAAEYFGEVLAENGVNVISGMAIGIDAAAHRGVLKAAGSDISDASSCKSPEVHRGVLKTSEKNSSPVSSGMCSSRRGEASKGGTYAVLAGGVNVIYPRENKYIYDEIISGGKGGIISEAIPGKKAISRNFPMRNRIISGLSDIVIVVEAREKSGSLITADYARRQGIPVMAVPGRVTDPMSAGTNKLIADGCGIAVSPEDILKMMKVNGYAAPVKNEEKLKLLDNTEKIVYGTVVSDPKHTELIIHEAGLSRDVVLETLISLEIKGFIGQVSSNYYVRK